MKFVKKLNPIQEQLIFLALLLSFWGLSGVFNNAFTDPNGLHFIRKTDSLAFIENYYLHGFRFFSPQNFNLLSVDGKGISEFPLLYYITSWLYALLGANPSWFNLVLMVLSTIGGLFAFKTLRLFNAFLPSLLGTLLVYSSTVLTYYSANFLVDGASVSFVMLGAYFGLKNTFRNPSSTNTFWALFFFTLAALTKAYFVIHGVGWLIIHIVHHRSLKKSLQLIKASVLPFLLLFGWILYVKWFNGTYQNDYYLTQFRPIWKLDWEQIGIVQDYISRFWWRHYYYPTAFHFFFLISAFIWTIFFIKKHTFPLKSTVIAILAIIYLLFFYQQFQDHDYYFLNLIPLFLFLVNDFIQTFGSFTQKRAHYFMLIPLAVMAILSLNYGSYKANQRFSQQEDDFSKIWFQLDRLDQKQVFSPLHFNGTDTVIVLNDLTRNGSLLYLKSFGFTHSTAKIAPQQIEEYRKKGASWLIDPFGNLDAKTAQELELIKFNDYVYQTQ